MKVFLALWGLYDAILSRVLNLKSLPLLMGNFKTSGRPIMIRTYKFFELELAALRQDLLGLEPETEANDLPMPVWFPSWGRDKTPGELPWIATAAPNMLIVQRQHFMQGTSWGKQGVGAESEAAA